MTKDDRFQYVWNPLGQLTQVKDLSGKTIATYTYDEDGKRTSSTVNGVTTNFYYDGDHVIYETDKNGNITAEYTWGANGTPVTMTKNDTVYYSHEDEKGRALSKSLFYKSFTYRW